MTKFKWIVIGLLACLSLIIVFQNLEPINVQLLFVKVSMPLAAMLTITLVVGFVLGLFASAIWRMQSWRARSKKDAATRKAPEGKASEEMV